MTEYVREFYKLPISGLHWLFPHFLIVPTLLGNISVYRSYPDHYRCRASSIQLRSYMTCSATKSNTSDHNVYLKSGWRSPRIWSCSNHGRSLTSSNSCPRLVTFNWFFLCSSRVARRIKPTDIALRAKLNLAANRYSRASFFGYIQVLTMPPVLVKMKLIAMAAALFVRPAVLFGTHAQ